MRTPLLLALACLLAASAATAFVQGVFGGYSGATAVQPGSMRETSDPIVVARAIDAEIRKLQEAPGVKDIFDLQRKIDAISVQSEREKNSLYQELNKLQQTDAYKDYREKVAALERQRQDQWDIDRKKLAAEAKQLYEARHAEIAKLAPGDLPGARALGFDILNYPRVDGSTSTHPLAVILACRVLNVRYEWRYPEPTGYPWDRLRDPGLEIWGAGSNSYRGSEFDLATSRAIAVGETPRDQRIAAMINGMLAANFNTHDAYVNLINGTCDLNLTARAPSEDETNLAREKKVELDLIPLAADGLVFVVHRDNSVKSLTLDQIKTVYQLQTKSWQPLGGPANDIHAYLREPNSGSRELFDALVMKTPTDEGFARATRSLISSGMSGPYNQITQDTNGLGYSVYYYEHFMALSPLTRTLAINGIEPSATTLASGKYPLTTTVYAVIRKSDPPTSAARKLVAYLATTEGQKLLRESGYVPAVK